MLSNIELVEEVLHLQNVVMFLQAQLREERQMNVRALMARALIGRMCAAPLVIQYDEGDEIIHTDEHPFCGDETCPCMDELYAEVERQEQCEPGDERYYR